MSSYVVDASVAVKWVVSETGSEAAARLARHDLVAPELILVEAANALWAKARRGELSHAEAAERLDALVAMPVLLVPSHRLVARAIDLALRLGHTVYDGMYLALALVRQAPLVTADRALLSAIRDGLHDGSVAVELEDI